MKKAIFYHAGCPVCVSAEQEIIELVGAEKLQIVHLGENKGQIDTAERSGVKSVPALVTETGNVLHINYGASLKEVRG
jgi:hypothetical protein